MSDDYASKGGAPRLKSQFAGPDLRAPIKAEPKSEPVATIEEQITGSNPSISDGIVKGGGSFRDPRTLVQDCQSAGGTAPQTYPRQKVIKVCHQFDLHPHSGDDGTFIFDMRPQRLFKPQGITAFGQGYCELSLDVGQDRIFTGITSAFFRNQIPYTDLLREVKDLQAVGGYTSSAAMAEVLERLQRGTARFQLTFWTCHVGSTITLRIQGVVPDAVVLWGDSL